MEDKFQYGGRQLVDAQGAEERILPDLFYIEILAGADAGLGSTQEFIDAERDHVNTGTDAARREGLVSDSGYRIRDAAAPQIFKGRNISALTQLSKLFEWRPLGETNHPKIARVYTEQEAGMLIDCSLVIFDPGAVCRTHFAQMGAATRHDFGNSKGIPDLDLFSPGNDNFSAFTQCVQHKKDCSGIVVHHDRRFAPEQLDECSADVDITLSALALFQIEFKIRIARRHFPQMFNGTLGQRRTAKIGVQNNAGRVDDTSKRRLERIAYAMSYSFGNRRG